MFGWHLARVTALFGCCVLTVACANSTPASIFDARVVERRQEALVLYFDLSNDALPSAAVAVNGDAAGAGAQRTIVLPFRAREFGNNEALLSTAASYGRQTIINYVSPPQSSRPEFVMMLPELDEQPDGPVTIEQLTGQVYLLRDGLRRRFIYRYSRPDAGGPSRALAGITPSSEVQAIGISLPPDGVPREVRNGRISIPDQIGQTDRTRYFPPSSTDVERIVLAYDVPPTQWQSLMLVYGVKVVAAVIIPLLGLLLVDSKDVVRPRVRVVALWAGALLEVAVLVAVWRVAWTTGGDKAVTAAADTAIVVVGAVFSGVVLFVKRKTPAAPPPRTSHSYQPPHDYANWKNVFTD